MTESSLQLEQEEEERRLQRKARRLAKKQAKLLADLGFDERGERRNSIESLTRPMRECQFTVPGLQSPIAINPVVSLIGFVCLWAIVIVSSLYPTMSLETIIAWRTTISLKFGWIFIGTRAVFLFFILYMSYKYGHIRLGRKSEKPAFSTSSYLAMLYACGVATGKFVYCIAEPLFHQHSNYYAQAGYHSQDEVDMFAINLTATNWGLSGYVTYSIVAVCMSLAAHRFGLPMTLRSCFYPMLGEYTWGWMGDVIDGLAIIVTVSGVCTDLGLGVIQIATGLSYMGWIDSSNDITWIQNLIIWIVTVISTASVVTGLQGGIQIMSFAAVIWGCVLVLVVGLLDDQVFLLNLQVQELGYYLQHSIFELNLWTDAFGQLREGSGRAIDGKAAEQWWMDSDSATFVVDMLASNGRQNQHWARQTIWAVTIGALASALLSSGGATALNAVQAITIVCALPFVILMCFMMQSIQLFCAATGKNKRYGEYQFPNEPEFTMPAYGGVFNIVEYLMSLGKVHASRVELGMDRPTGRQIAEFVKGLVVPFVSLRQVLSST